MKLLKFLSILFLLIGGALALRAGRIAGGEAAVRGQFPWHVKIEAFDGRSVHICGGALVRSDYVLTTAICIKDSVDIILRFGIVDRLEGPTSAIFRITSRDHIIIHENFNSTTFSYDLALLYLEGAETLLEDDYVDILPLPTAEDAENDFIGLRGYVTGFGLTNDDDPPLLSMVLNYVELPIISNIECQQVHGNSISFDDKFCLDGSFGSTCIGDEGAPFAVTLNGRQLLGGIGSVALDRCQAGFPSIFTNLLPHLEWIEDNTAEPPAVDTTTTEPPQNDRCNCVCRCYTCPAPQPAGMNSFQKRWLEN